MILRRKILYMAKEQNLQTSRLVIIPSLYGTDPFFLGALQPIVLPIPLCTSMCVSTAQLSPCPYTDFFSNCAEFKEKCQDPDIYKRCTATCSCKSEIMQSLLGYVWLERKYTHRYRYKCNRSTFSTGAQRMTEPKNTNVIYCSLPAPRCGGPIRFLFSR